MLRFQARSVLCKNVQQKEFDILNSNRKKNVNLNNVVGGRVDSALRHRLGDEEEVIPEG